MYRQASPLCSVSLDCECSLHLRKPATRFLKQQLSCQGDVEQNHRSEPYGDLDLIPCRHGARRVGVGRQLLPNYPSFQIRQPAFFSTTIINIIQVRYTTGESGETLKVPVIRTSRSKIHNALTVGLFVSPLSCTTARASAKFPNHLEPSWRRKRDSQNSWRAGYGSLCPAIRFQCLTARKYGLYTPF